MKMKINLEPEPEDPQDIKSKTNSGSAFMTTDKSGLYFSVLSIFVVQAVIIYSTMNNSNNMNLQQIPSTTKIYNYQNEVYLPLPFNSIIINIFRFFLRIPNEAGVVILASLYTFISTFLFRKVLRVLKLSKYANPITCIYLIYPFSRITSCCIASRDILLLILIYLSIILYHQNQYIVLNFILLLASITSTEGIILYIAAALSYTFRNTIVTFIYTIQIYPVYLLQVKMGFQTLLLPNFIEYLKFFITSISYVRETNGILEYILISIFGILFIWFHSPYAFVLSFLFWLNGLVLSISTDIVRGMTIPLTLSLIGFSSLITPRLRFALYASSVLFLIPAVFHASLPFIQFQPSKDELVN